MIEVRQRQEGQLAYCDGKELVANPYEPKSEAWNRWRLGWLNAQQRDPLRDNDEE